MQANSTGNASVKLQCKTQKRGIMILPLGGDGLGPTEREARNAGTTLSFACLDPYYGNTLGHVESHGSAALSANG